MLTPRAVIGIRPAYGRPTAISDQTQASITLQRQILRRASPSDLDQLASTLSFRSSLRASGQPQRAKHTSAVKHDDHSIRTTKARQTADPCLAAPIERIKRPRHPEPAKTKHPTSSRSPLPNTPIRNRIESLFTMSKSHHDAAPTGAASGHCRPKDKQRQTLVRLDPIGEALIACGSALIHRPDLRQPIGGA